MGHACFASCICTTLHVCSTWLPLLPPLNVPYLHASTAEVDYAAWVRQRLREAAAELAAGPLPAENSDVPQEGASEQDAVVTAPAHGGQAPHEAPDSLQLPNAHFATDPAAPAPPQLYFSGCVDTLQACSHTEAWDPFFTL